MSAIIRNNPSNSHLVSNIFVNIENVPVLWNYPDVWTNLSSDVMYSYVRLAPGTDIIDLQAKSANYVVDNTEIGSEFLDLVDIVLQPVSAIHFTSDLQNEMSIQDDITGIVKPIRQPTDILIFGAVAALTLAIAIFNFMNLQIVQSSKRAHEVGVRRTTGASPSNLATQFLVETVILSFLALLVSLLICELLTPYFSLMVAVPLTLAPLFSISSLTLALLLTLLVALVSGTYPAVIIARLGVISALKGEVTKSVSTSKEISIRKVLGATARSLAGMLAWDFSKLVILANLIAWPAAWWLMQDWLTSFAYRTEINFTIFLLARLVTFMMALLTTFQRAYSAAISNPVDALRIE